MLLRLRVLPVWPVARQRLRSRGFTLLELMVVIAIMALATVGATLAMRDGQQSQLEREATRLAALLEAGRAQSRAQGVAVRWQLTNTGFEFVGLNSSQLPRRWLDADTAVIGPAQLVLGPEPLIGAQQVVLTKRSAPQYTLRVATDGLRPFSVETLP